MNIEQITRRVSDYEARENIHQQFLKEILILGEREALEFARFRADALADANEQAAQSFHRGLIIGAIYAAALAFAIGFMIGRAHQPQPAKQALAIAQPLPLPTNPDPWAGISDQERLRGDAEIPQNQAAE